MFKIRSLILVLLLSLSVAGCANFLGSAAEPGNELRIREDVKPGPNARPEKYQITVRMAGYTDARQVDSPRRVGTSNARITGLTGKDIMSDRDATEVVAESMKKRLSDAGLQVLVGDASNAQLQLSGTVKELSIDIKDRDYVNIAVESTLTEVASGKVIWSGLVVERAERYAGTSGNGKKDVADFLKWKLGVVSTKTTESVLSVLMATRPELFNMAVGIKPVQGVTVYSNSAGSAASAVVPAATQSESMVANGMLVISSNPSRAKVYVDGVYFGLTPLRAEYGAGIHEVNVKLEGYKTSSEKVSVRKGDNTEMDIKLQR
ncbi:MAG: PEGA domain-containing protein [Sideroxydans sp.]|jgi:hypothetical protein